jgi:hypothetical protein
MSRLIICGVKPPLSSMSSWVDVLEADLDVE